MVARGQWRDYEDGKKREFVRRAREFVYSLPEPWRYGNGSARVVGLRITTLGL